MKRIAIASLFCIAIAGFARAAAPATFVVTLDDFSKRSIRVDSIDATTIVGFDLDQKADVRLPATRAISLAQPPAATHPASTTNAFVLARTNGERLIGRPGAIAGDALRFKTSLLGEWQVPLASIVTLTRVGTIGPTAGGTPATQDEIRLTNGDAIAGIVSEATDERVTCKSADGQAVPIEWANVRQLRFAQPPGEPQPGTPTFRLTLADDSRVAVTDLRMEAGRVRATAGERSIDVDATTVTRLESLAGSTRLLSDIAPTNASRASFFPRFASPSDGGRTAAIAAQDGATSAIAARPRSTLTWPTAGAAAFHGRYTIPAGLPRADVSIRVLADDRVLFDRQHVRAGEPSVPIDVPLGSAKSITLEVDFGDNYDAQDEFYWLDAALVGATK